MKESVERFWNEHPLLAILIIALIPRLIAAIFSKGYGMHDDHFGPIEQPFIIMQNISYWTSRANPHGHSIVYPLIHYVLFNGLEYFGIMDPQFKMYIVRFLHAFYSLIVVFFGFKIAERLSDQNTAKEVGLILALFWAFPFLSVRNLIEMVCIPPLMAGFYYSLISRERTRNAFIAGLCFGLAFVFRYQTLSISGTLGFIFLFRKEFKQMFLLAGGFLVTAIIIQGSVDIFAWGYPFASFLEYVGYNARHGEDYTTGPWYNYLFLVSGAMIPPMSLLILYGLLKNWRKSLLILLPVIVFFVLHSTFPNKQERFIFPVVPIILVLSVVGWEEFVKTSTFWLRHQIMLRSFWAWFWMINIILLIPFSLFYSKKSRVESMYALYGKQIKGIVLVGDKLGITQPPRFYAGVFSVPFYEIENERQIPQVQAQLKSAVALPNYAIFYGTEDIDKRVQQIDSTLGLKLVLDKRIDASFLDDVFYRLNPKHNKNETIIVYKNVDQ